MKSQNAEVIDHIKKIRRFHRQTCHSPKICLARIYVTDCVILKILNNSTNFEQFMFVMIGSIASNSNWFFVLLFDRSNWQNQLVWRERTWKMLISWNVKIAYFIHFNTFVSVRNDVFVTKWKLRSSTRYCVHAFFIILNHTKRTDDTGLAILSILEVVYDKPLWTT